jgi:hypothetical protein
MDKAIVFSDHAVNKINVLKRHGVGVTLEFIEDAIKNPDIISRSYGGRLVVEKGYNSERVIRVVYEERNDIIVVVTVYPSRRGRYDKD